MFLDGRSEDLVRAIEGTPEFVGTLEAAGPDAVPILIKLVDHPDFGDRVIEFLHDQGDDIAPMLQEASRESPGALETLQWIIDGERPDVHSLRSLYIDRLVDQLEDPNPNRAMHLLHDLGDDAVQKLILAKADPDIRELADQLLRWHFTGESPWGTSDTEDHVPLHGGDNPLRITDLVDEKPFGEAAPPIQPLLDVDHLTTLLRDQETSMDTLSALVQIGTPAMPALCEILMRTRR